MTNTLDSLALTHLDVYDEMDEIKLRTAYDIGGIKTAVFPTSIEALEKARPVLKSFKDWKKSIKNCRSFDELPKKAKTYISLNSKGRDSPTI
jgi:adenylosuccinate synthase